MFFPWVFQGFSPQTGKCPAHPATRGSWHDHLVDEPFFSRNERIGETFFIVFRMLGNLLSIPSDQHDG